MFAGLRLTCPSSGYSSHSTCAPARRSLSHDSTQDDCSWSGDCQSKGGKVGRAFKPALKRFHSVYVPSLGSGNPLLLRNPSNPSPPMTYHIGSHEPAVALTVRNISDFQYAYIEISAPDRKSVV